MSMIKSEYKPTNITRFNENLQHPEHELNEFYRQAQNVLRSDIGEESSSQLSGNLKSITDMQRRIAQRSALYLFNNLVVPFCLKHNYSFVGGEVSHFRSETGAVIDLTLIPDGDVKNMLQAIEAPTFIAQTCTFGEMMPDFNPMLKDVQVVTYDGYEATLKGWDKEAGKFKISYHPGAGGYLHSYEFEILPA